MAGPVAGAADTAEAVAGGIGSASFTVVRMKSGEPRYQASAARHSRIPATPTFRSGVAKNGPKTRATTPPILRRSGEVDVLTDAELAGALVRAGRDDQILDGVADALEYGALGAVGPTRRQPGDDLAKLHHAVRRETCELPSLGERRGPLIDEDPRPARERCAGENRRTARRRRDDDVRPLDRRLGPGGRDRDPSELRLSDAPRTQRIGVAGLARHDAQLADRPHRDERGELRARLRARAEERRDPRIVARQQ